MATDQEVDRLRKAIDAIFSFEKESLIRRTKWGEINFESAQRDVDRIFDVLNHLKILPLEYLPDTAVTEIVNPLTEVKTVFDQIDKFNIQVANPSDTRNTIVRNVHSYADNLYRQASPWVPFLAYQKGDVSKNIGQLTDSVNQAKLIIDGAKGDIAAKSKEIDGIIVKARESSAAAGAAVFTQDFDKESKNLVDRAKVWLRATWIIAVLTFVVAGTMWYITEPGLDQSQVWQKLTTKLAILALLISATAWCGKIYKALVHQSTVNRHRALSLQTFQAFSNAASDVQTKDAVLLQTTKAIFNDASTGFIDGTHTGSDNDIKIFEIVKSFLPKSNPN